jgi:ketosteroid isomerase-like protein
MSQENVETVRSIYGRWAAGEIEEGMAAYIAPTIEVFPDPRSAWPGIEAVYHGHDGIARYLASIYDAFIDYRAEPERLLDAKDRVVVLAIERGRGRYSDAFAEIRHTAHIWTLENGKAIRLDVNWDRSAALEAVGLAE